MIKAELISKVSVFTGVSTADTRAVIEAAFKEIKNSVKRGEGFFFRGFGTFDRKRRAKKTARNISKGTVMIIPEHDIPHFKPSREFSKEVKVK